MNHFHHPARYESTQVRPKNLMSVWLAIKNLLVYGVLFSLLSTCLLVFVLRFLPAPTSAFMLRQHVEDFIAGQGYRSINQHWVDSTNISKYALSAVIASEDQLFYEHNGFDVAAITSVFKHYLAGGKLRGASTISQQTAKNLFLSPSRSVVRKCLEMGITVLLETLWNKSRILEVYLNIAQFGDHLYGIEAASRHYFGIPAKQLSAEQAALLAATLPNPLLLKVGQPSEYLYKRQKWILRQMRNR